MNNLAWELVRLCVACGAETFKGCTVCKACGVVDENGIQYLQTSKRKVIVRSEQVDGDTKAKFYCYQWSGIGTDAARYLQPHGRLTEIAEDTPPVGIEVKGYSPLSGWGIIPVPIERYETWKVEYIEAKKQLRENHQRKRMAEMIIKEEPEDVRKPRKAIGCAALLVLALFIFVLAIKFLH